MKRLFLVLILAVVAVGAYILYFHHKVNDDENEQQWLKREFALSDAQLAAIERLERDYRPICDGHCADYMAAHARMEALLAQNAVWRPEMAQAMEALYRSQMECHQDMLKHAYDVSAVMAPDQAHRYLSMILGRLALTAPDEMQRDTR